jgi:hypothetical protein
VSDLGQWFSLLFYINSPMTEKCRKPCSNSFNKVSIVSTPKWYQQPVSAPGTPNSYSWRPWRRWSGSRNQGRIQTRQVD